MQGIAVQSPLGYDRGTQTSPSDGLAFCRGF